MTLEIVSIVAGLVSILIGGMAISLSLWFYRQTKDTEKEVSGSLIKIETQAEMLQKITGKQLDRLTKFVTEPKKEQSDENFTKVFEIIAQLPQMLLPQPYPINATDKTHEIQIWVALYFYSAQTNWLSTTSLPEQSDFDTGNAYHAHIKRIVDLSAADFRNAATALSRYSDPELKACPTYHLLEETMNVWSKGIRDSSEYYIDRARNSEPA